MAERSPDLVFARMYMMYMFPRVQRIYVWAVRRNTAPSGLTKRRWDDGPDDGSVRATCRQSVVQYQ